MRIIDAGFEFKWSSPTTYEEIEDTARICYKSEGLIVPGSANRLIKKLHDREHWAIFNHVFARVKFIIDRGVSHELVRHRVGIAFAQESTRYCNYNKDKFNNEISVINPCFYDEGSRRFDIWYNAMIFAEKSYMELIKEGSKPEEARSVLPNSLKTEIIVTADFTEWRHIFSLRTSPSAHPQMREVMIPLLKEFKNKWPEVFEDL